MIALSSERKKMEELISIIVPVYKVEQYLDMCIESLVNQSYDTLEIILVDDGSPDRCPDICEKWAEKDKRIKVIHKKNGGLSDARNVGFAAATGDWISFIDSDDWIDSRFYEKLKELADRGADIVECSTILVDENGEQLGIQKSIDCELNTVDAMKHLINEDILRQTVWNKIYRSELLKGTSFLVGKCNEDDFWTYQIIAKATKVICCSNALYFYRQRLGSIMNRTYSLKRLDGIEARKQRYMYIAEKFPMLINNEKKKFFFTILYAYQNSLQINNKEERKLCIETLKKYYRFWKKAPGVFESNKVSELFWMNMANISIAFTAILRNILGIGG